VITDLRPLPAKIWGSPFRKSLKETPFWQVFAKSPVLTLLCLSDNEQAFISDRSMGMNFFTMVSSI
jgi:hypothetical protein